MDKEIVRLMLLSGVLSIRFHPRNDVSRETVENEVCFACDVVDLAIREMESRKWLGSELPPQ